MTQVVHLLGSLRRVILRPFRRLRRWFLVGRPIPFFFPHLRQVLNLRYQERRHLREWTFARSYLALPQGSAAIFIHIPKTAGTYVANSLVAKAGFEVLNPSAPPRTNRLVLPHYTIDWLVSNHVLSRDFVLSATVFTVVREPVERLISAFGHLKRLGSVPEKWSFETFLRYLQSERPIVGGGRVNRLSHAAPQSSWVRQTTTDITAKLFFQHRMAAAGEWLSSYFGADLALEKRDSVGSSRIKTLSTAEKKLTQQLAAIDAWLFESEDASGVVQTTRP